MKSVYVGNLPPSLVADEGGEEKLKAMFGKYGDVETVFVYKPRPGDASASAKRNFAFVHYASRESALAAAEAGKRSDDADATPSAPIEIDGCALDVTMAKPMKDQGRAAAGGGGRGGGGRGGRARGGNFRDGGDYRDDRGFGGYRDDRGGHIAPRRANIGMMGGGMGMGMGMVIGMGMGMGVGGGGGMVPMMLPNGQVGYVIQPGPPPGPPSRGGGYDYDDRGNQYRHRGGGGGGGRGGGRGGGGFRNSYDRHRPY